MRHVFSNIVTSFHDKACMVLFLESHPTEGKKAIHKQRRLNVKEENTINNIVDSVCLYVDYILILSCIVIYLC